MKSVKKILVLIGLLAVNSAYGLTVVEDAEDTSISGWKVRVGSADDITNVYDKESDSRVIQLNGGGSYILGGTYGESVLDIRGETAVSWRMRTEIPYTIFVIVESRKGLRYLFYTYSPNRGLLHGFEGGILHGLGALTIDGRWRTITRDLERDLKDAEPENEIIAINGFMYNGGDGGMIDDIVFYTPQETIYEDGESGIGSWQISDNDPSGATITNIADNDRQGRDLQGHIIAFKGNGFDNAYRLGATEGANAWNNQIQKIVQWRFRAFGSEPEVLLADPDERGTVRDLKAFEFRVHVETSEGLRDLTYTLGETLGVIENGMTLHHGLGDDRIRGSVWAGDNPMNEMGLWQTVTRNLEEDIKDFEPDNQLLAVNGFEVRNSGLVDDIKMLSDYFIEETAPSSENNTASTNSVAINWGLMILYSMMLMAVISFFLKRGDLYIDKNSQIN